MATINFVWDELSDNVLLETDELGAVTAQNSNHPEQFGELLSQYRSGVESYFHFDEGMSTRQLTNENEDITDTLGFTAYGEEFESTGTTVNPFGYKGAVGYYSNGETDDIYVRARTYEPALGVWLSKDPLGFVDGASMYRGYFVPGGIDPSGLENCSEDHTKCHAKCERDFPMPKSQSQPALYYHGQELNGCYRECNWEYHRCKDRNQPPRPKPPTFWEEVEDASWAYGNYCGPFKSGQGGAPIDEVDRCCMVHDSCLATWKEFLIPGRVWYCDEMLTLCVVNAACRKCHLSPDPKECRFRAAQIAAWMHNLGTTPGIPIW